MSELRILDRCTRCHAGLLAPAHHNDLMPDHHAFEEFPRTLPVEFHVLGEVMDAQFDAEQLGPIYAISCVEAAKAALTFARARLIKHIFESDTAKREALSMLDYEISMVDEWIARNS